MHEGITCNMIAPGWVDTPNERLIQARFGRPDFPAGIRNLTTPEEIGAAVVYLASPHGPQDQRRDPLPRRRACRSPTTPAWSICPIASGRRTSNESKS